MIVKVGLDTSSPEAPKPAGETADECGLAGAEIAEQQDDVPRPKGCGKLLAGRFGFFFGGCDDVDRHDASRGRVFRRAVSSRMASPIRDTRSVAISDTSPSSASARSPADPCR